MTDGRGEGAQIVRLHPVRTLVIASDLAFRRRATTVLAELGVVMFALPGGGRMEDIVDLACRERPDVLVLDVTGHRASTIAAVACELCLHAQNMGIVLVASGEAHDLRLPVVAKWGWAADLLCAVRGAYHHGNRLCEEASSHATT